MDNEVKKIRIFPDNIKEYYAGSDGKIYNTHKALKEHAQYIHLKLKGVEQVLRIDQLVAGAFNIKPTKDRPFLHHKDLNQYNNNINNLEYVNNNMIRFKEDDVWKDIPGYGDNYQLSIDGKVRSHHRYVQQHNKPNETIFKKGKELKVYGTATKYLFLTENSKRNRVRIKDLQRQLKWGI